MSTARPLKAKNAIDEIAFVVVFERELDDKTLISLFALRDELGESLPDFEIVNQVKFVVDNQNPQMPISKSGGVLLSKKNAADLSRFEWSLRVETNKITVGCSEFTDWDIVWATAKQYLFAAMSKFDTNINPVVEVMLRVVDKFIDDADLKAYQIGNIFDVESRYLSRNLVDLNTSSWHLHQGWFMYPDNTDIRALHNLNINALKPDDKFHETVVSHLIKVRRCDETAVVKKSVLLGEEGAVGHIEQAMIESHKANKKVLMGLLNQSMLTAIGMRE
ncbi:TIGR04255 family protein [Porticoccaceae bacterium]|nr:TIGR04255 family protein [Porticoccaceae bacterium]